MAQGLRVITVFTQKGGVGKSTAALNVATTLALGGARVLLVDGDPQANLTRNVISYILIKTMVPVSLFLNDVQREIIINLVQENVLLRTRETVKSAVDIIVEAYKSANTVEQEKSSSAEDGKSMSAEEIEKNFPKLIEIINKISASATLLKTLNWLNRDVGVSFIDNAASDVSNQLLEVSFEEKDKVVENLFLLSGHQNLYLACSRPIALAIEGLTSPPDSALSAFASRLFKINEMIRKIGEKKDIDIIVIDLSPSAIEFNEAFVMMSDYLMMTLSPEPNSDHAMLSMLPILKRWKSEFDRIYEVESESGFRTIAGPPKGIGVFFQKVNKQLNNVKSTIAKFIIDRIETFHDTDLTKFLESQGMSGGVEAAHLPKIPHFTAEGKKVQFAGGPVVLTDLAFQYNFKKLIASIFQHQKDAVPPRVVHAVDMFMELQRKKIENINKVWADKYIEYFRGMDANARFKSLAKFKHHYDYFDFTFILVHLAKKYSIDYSSENPNGIFLSMPIVLDNSVSSENYFIKPLETVLIKISNWQTPPRFIIIPFMLDLRWRCVRVQISPTSPTLDVLFDDPFGGELIRVTKNKRIEFHVWDERLQGSLFDALCIVLSKHLKRSFNSMTPRCKNINQQDENRNYEGLSGLIILTNIVSYLEKKNNGDFPAISSYKMLTNYARKNNLEIEVSGNANAIKDTYSINIAEYNMQHIKKAYAIGINNLLKLNDNRLIEFYAKFIDTLKAGQFHIAMQKLSEKMLDAFVFNNLDLILEDERDTTDHVFSEQFDENPNCIVDFIAHAQIHYNHSKRPKDKYTKSAIQNGRRNISNIIQGRKSMDIWSMRSMQEMLNIAFKLSETKFSEENKRRDFFGLTSYQVHYNIGNCLFEAVAAFTSNSMNAAVLRQRAVEYIRENNELRERILSMANDPENAVRVINADIVYEDVEDYLQLMAKDQAWGTYIELVALANVLQRPIVVFTPENVEMIMQNEYHNNEPIFINYINNNHYEPLATPPNIAARDVFRNIEQSNQQGRDSTVQHADKRRRVDAPRAAAPSSRPVLYMANRSTGAVGQNRETERLTPTS